MADAREPVERDGDGGRQGQEPPPRSRPRPGTFTPGLNPAVGTVWRTGGESLAERRIREATERGDFDVPVEARRRRLDLGNPDDPDWWLKRYMAREGIDLADALPAPLALRREAERFPDSLADLTGADQVRAVVQDYNRRVVAEWRRPRSNRDLPVVPHQVDVEEAVLAWQDLRARLAAEAAEHVVPPGPDEADQDPPRASQDPARRRSRRLFGVRLRRRR